MTYVRVQPNDPRLRRETQKGVGVRTKNEDDAVWRTPHACACPLSAPANRAWGLSPRLMFPVFAPQVASDSAWIHDIVNKETKAFFNSVRDSKTERGEVRRMTEELDVPVGSINTETETKRPFDFPFPACSHHLPALPGFFRRQAQDLHVWQGRGSGVGTVDP